MNPLEIVHKKEEKKKEKKKKKERIPTALRVEQPKKIGRAHV